MRESRKSCNTLSDTQASGALARRARRARRRLPWLRPRLDALHDGLVADRGGPGALSTAEGVLVEMAVDSYCVALFLMNNIETRGCTKRDGSLRPAVLSLATYQNTLRLHLQALGLQRRARDVTPDLCTIWTRQDGGQAGGGGGKVPPDGQNPLPEAERSAEDKPEGRRGSNCYGDEVET